VKMDNEASCLLPMNSVSSRCTWIDGADADCSAESVVSEPDEDGCCMAILKSSVSVCSGHEVQEACEDRTSCFWIKGEDVDCEWIDDSDDRDLNKKLSDLLADGETPILEEEENSEGCCAGSTERTTALCNIVAEDVCDDMAPCHWEEGPDANCAWPPESEVESAKFFVFGGGSGIGGVMETRLSITSVICVLLAITLLHFAHRCWLKRRDLKKETMDTRHEYEYEQVLISDDEDEVVEKEEPEGTREMLDEESMYFQYV